MNGALKSDENCSDVNDQHGVYCEAPGDLIIGCVLVRRVLLDFIAVGCDDSYRWLLAIPGFAVCVHFVGRNQGLADAWSLWSRDVD